MQRQNCLQTAHAYAGPTYEVFLNVRFPQWFYSQEKGSPSDIEDLVFCFIKSKTKKSSLFPVLEVVCISQGRT